MNVRPANRPLQLAPMAFNRIRVCDAVNPNIFGVVDRAVLVAKASKLAIGAVFVRADIRAARHVPAHYRFNRLFQPVRDWASDHAPVALDHAKHNGLVLHRPLASASRSAIAPADERLVNLDMPGQRPVAIRRRHELAKFMRHAPRRFVGATDLPLQFLRGNAVAGRSHEVHREKPVRELRTGLVKDGPGARVNVMAALLAGVSLPLPHGMKLGVNRPAAGAGELGPAELDFHELRQTGRIIGQVGLELLESIFHGGNPYLLPVYRDWPTCCQGINAEPTRAFEPQLSRGGIPPDQRTRKIRPPLLLLPPGSLRTCRRRSAAADPQHNCSVCLPERTPGEGVPVYPFTFARATIGTPKPHMLQTNNEHVKRELPS